MTTDECSRRSLGSRGIVRQHCRRVFSEAGDINEEALETIEYIDE